MGVFARWLLHEDQKEWFDYFFALSLNAVFVAVIALLLWPFGKATVALSLGKAYWMFWTVLIVTSAVMVLAQRIFRMDLYSHYDAYVISGLIVSGFVQVGWSAYAASVVRSSAAEASIAVAIVLFIVGVISSWVASVIVGVYYMGSIYRTVNSLLGILSFVVFCVWPAAGLAIYGWFFDLF